MIDGDHSGGQYNRFGATDPRNMRQAQGYGLMLDDLGGLHRQIWLKEEHWADDPPFSDGGGVGGSGGTSVIEFYVTPFDTLGQTPSVSRRTGLASGRVSGIAMMVYDSDKEWTQGDTTHVLGAVAGGSDWLADRFVDLMLLPAEGATAAGHRAWGWVKEQHVLSETRVP